MAEMGALPPGRSLACSGRCTEHDPLRGRGVDVKVEVNARGPRFG